MEKERFKQEEKGVILDTNIFNLLLDGKISIESISKAVKISTQSNKEANFHASPVQYEELKKTRDINRPNRRGDLLKTFSLVSPTEVPSVFMVEVPGAGVNEGELCDQEISLDLERISRDLKYLDKKARKRSTTENHYSDVSTAYSAIRNNLLLITGDVNLTLVAAWHNVKVIQYYDKAFYFYKKLITSM